jgi:hypothetical protein
MLQFVAIFISFAVILYGIKKKRLTGKDYYQSFPAVIGICICILFLGINFYENRQIEFILRHVFGNGTIGKIEKRLAESDLSAKQRALLEKHLAIEIYVKENRQIFFKDEDGRSVLFYPSDEDKTYKKSRDDLNKWLLKDRSDSRNAMILWASVLFSSILLGRHLPIRQSKVGH